MFHLTFDTRTDGLQQNHGAFQNGVPAVNLWEMILTRKGWGCWLFLKQPGYALWALIGRIHLTMGVLNIKNGLIQPFSNSNCNIVVHIVIFVLGWFFSLPSSSPFFCAVFVFINMCCSMNGESNDNSRQRNHTAERIGIYRNISTTSRVVRERQQANTLITHWNILCLQSFDSVFCLFSFLFKHSVLRSK